MKNEGKFKTFPTVFCCCLAWFHPIPLPSSSLSYLLRYTQRNKLQGSRIIKINSGNYFPCVWMRQHQLRGRRERGWEHRSQTFSRLKHLFALTRFPSNFLDFFPPSLANFFFRMKNFFLVRKKAPLSHLKLPNDFILSPWCYFWIQLVSIEWKRVCDGGKKGIKRNNFFLFPHFRYRQQDLRRERWKIVELDFVQSINHKELRIWNYFDIKFSSLASKLLTSQQQIASSKRLSKFFQALPPNFSPSPSI